MYILCIEQAFILCLEHAGQPATVLGCQLEAKSSAAGNVFWKSNAWKRCVITGVMMCPRADMYKPPCGKLTMDAALTDTQEAKQALRHAYLEWTKCVGLNF